MRLKFFPVLLFRCSATKSFLDCLGRGSCHGNNRQKIIPRQSNYTFSGHYVIGSPLPRLHHHDIMTIVGLFMYRSLQYVEYHMVKKQMKILSVVAEDDSTDNL